jgi:hypothetical protein
MQTEPRWYNASRQKLPGLLVGVEHPTGEAFDRPEQAFAIAGDFVVGYSEAFRPGGATSPPQVVLLQEGRASELLGWLHTYSEESFPISQYCRVHTLQEWSMLSQNRAISSSDRGSLGPVSSLIVGEMLAQGESDLNLSAVPLSWANGCFSLAMAQVMRMHGHSEDAITRAAAERLHMCEDNARFARRPVGVYALAPMWSMLSQQGLMRGSVTELCLAVVSALSPSAVEILRSNEALRSNSAEQRVRGFDAVSDEAMALGRLGGPQRTHAGALLAASTLMVGGGTSHVELLQPSLHDIPESLAWFGLMAGFAGPAAWDPAWLRLVKGVERHLSAMGVIADAGVLGDLAWVEYEWLSNLSDDTSAYAGFPKQYQRLLTIEIMPNAPCQFRLQPMPRGKSSTTAQRASDSHAASGFRQATSMVGAGASPAQQWSRIRSVASELAQLLQAAQATGTGDELQQALFDGESSKPSRKPAKGRVKGGANKG